jgi:hypothetical protein
VEQNSAHVEHHVKTGPKQWLLQEYDGPDTSLTLSNLEFTILLRDLYNKVQFESDAPVLEPDDEPL